MGKIIRPTYPVEISIGLLLLIFVVSFFLSPMIFDVPWGGLLGYSNIYLGMFLVSCAVVIMALILWEEFLFPIKVKTINGGVVFRNHSKKLNKQLLIYLAIPVIFAFVYFNYEVSVLRFSIWAGICILVPAVTRLFSGINNYNDYLMLTDAAIEYKNNRKSGTYKLIDVRQIELVEDQGYVLHKFKLSLANNQTVVIDLDEMELESFYMAIDQFIRSHYESYLKK